MNSNTSETNNITWPERPYKGLSYYEPKDMPIFAGRDSDREHLARIIALHDCRVIILHGSTGCGKSSFLRADLIPFLERKEHGFDFLKKGDKSLFVRSTDNPIAALSDHLYDFLKGIINRKAPDEKPYEINLSNALPETKDKNDYRNRVNNDYNIILESFKNLSKKLPETFVVVIDQAEEVITLNQRKDRQFYRFIADFSKLEIDIKILIVIRTEYYGRFDNEIHRYTLDPTKIRKFYLPELDKENLKRAIEQPTSTEIYKPYNASPRQKYRFSYETDLSDKIAEDILKAMPDGGILAAMQIVCGRLYNKVRQNFQNGNDSVISEKDYRDLGGIEGQVEQYLEEVLEDFCKENEIIN